MKERMNEKMTVDDINQINKRARERERERSKLIDINYPKRFLLLVVWKRQRWCLQWLTDWLTDWMNVWMDIFK